MAGPFCSNRLLLAGARVIKIERKDGGDFARGYDTAAKGDSSYFVWLNQGKESIGLDLKEEEDKKIFLNIIRKADVFIQNFAPNTMTKLGLEKTELKKVNPELIVCDISGYGKSPLLSGKKTYDLLIQAESGLIDVSGSPDGEGGDGGAGGGERGVGGEHDVGAVAQGSPGRKEHHARNSRGHGRRRGWNLGR